MAQSKWPLCYRWEDQLGCTAPAFCLVPLLPVDYDCVNYDVNCKNGAWRLALAPLRHALLFACWSSLLPFWVAPFSIFPLRCSLPSSKFLLLISSTRSPSRDRSPIVWSHVSTSFLCSSLHGLVHVLQRFFPLLPSFHPIRVAHVHVGEYHRQFT